MITTEYNGMIAVIPPPMLLLAGYSAERVVFVKDSRTAHRGRGRTERQADHSGVFVNRLRLADPV
ncbi:hypothetical protein GCM10023161_42070 [Mycobacterium paraffinicum]|uniref:Uncharacterized protein n=1 Tax=Mycobacterium paraffinicum TaxID=53378 RepID=A0ABP8F2Y1_9MYCO